MKDQSLYRKEIIERVKILHNLLTIATLLLAVSLGLGLYIHLNASEAILNWYLLSVPVVFACLAFNYQANHMTIEAVAGYLKESGDSWEEYWGRYKQKAQLTSFLKVLPLLIPLLIPFFVSGAETGQMWLRYLDFALLVLVFVNFRYLKLR